MDFPRMEFLAIKKVIMDGFYISDVLEGFNTSLPVILTASVINTFIGFLLLSFEVNSSRNKPKTFKYAYYSLLLPLLLAPVLLSLFISKFSQSIFGLSSNDNPWILLFGGILFHSWIAYYLLKHIFNAHIKLITFKSIDFNLASSNSNYKSLSLFVIIFIKPILFTLFFCVLLNQSMISLPTFTGGKVETYISHIYNFISNLMNGNPEVNTSYILISIISFIILNLGIVYLFVQLIRSIHLYKFKKNILFLFKRNSIKGLNLNLFLYLSSGVFFLFSVFVLLAIANKSEFIWDENFIKIIRSLFGKHLIIIFISFTLFLTIYTISLKYLPYYFGDRIFQHYQKFITVISYFALLPPVIFGLIAFLSAGKNNSNYIEFFTLILYSFLLILFFFNKTSVLKHIPIYLNTKNMRHNRKKRILTIQLTDLYKVSIPLFITMYFLWIEDGITTLLSDEPNNFANTIRGLYLSDLSPQIYLGVLICFLFYLVLIFGIQKLQNIMKKIVIKSLQKQVIYIGLFFTILISSVSSANAGVNDFVIASKMTSIDSTVSMVEIKSLHVNFKDKCYLDIGNCITKLRIDTLNFNYDKSILCIRGGSQNVDIEIKHVIGSNTPSKCPDIKFENIYLNRVDINEDNHHYLEESSFFNLDLRDGKTSFRTINVMNSCIPDITIRANFKSKNILLKNISTSNIDIKSNSSDLPTVNMELVNISFVPILLDHLSIRIEKINISNFRLETYNKSDYSLNLILRDLKLFGQNKIVTNNVNTSLEIFKLNLLSNLSISGNSYKDLIVSEVSSTSKEPSNLSIDAPISLSGDIKLIDVKLNQVSINLGSKIYSKLDNIELRDLQATSKIIIDKELLKWYSENCSNPIVRRDILKHFKEKGVYEDSQAIGLQAVYYDKKSDLSSLFRPLSWVIDKLTGFGIELLNPLITFLILLLGYLVIRLILVYKLYNGFSFSFFDLILDDKILADTEKAKEKKALYLKILRLSFNILVFIQITLLSIYLSQTTLQ
ncbi:hypothetical protein HNS38_10280 [Lentimicrobium sp. L6]|uniref:hypothetical protein n=1 Tax=Lentimicrobium sp. L6 TaxID=2735916 RepID=UPI001552EF3A|nr:hypothetical protein [Lentimicrobium sp. L6]NPD85148.1 hypothetical protein [Lentimicrobium sp. L6]